MQILTLTKPYQTEPYYTIPHLDQTSLIYEIMDETLLLFIYFYFYYYFFAEFGSSGL